MTYQRPHQHPINLHELALRFEKRRFDGGVELELIEQIEQQQARQLAQAGLITHDGAGLSSRPQPQYRAQAIRPAQGNYASPQSQPRTKASMLWETIIVGPLQIAVGLVGMLTSVLALATFLKNKNEAMAQQSKQIMRDCSLTFVRGFLHMALMPVRLVKLAFTK